MAPQLSPVPDPNCPLECSFEGCPKPQRASGYCRGHYNQLNKGQELRPLRERRSVGAKKEPCKYQECTKPSRSQGYCSRHYALLMRTGQLDIVAPREGSDKHGASMYRNRSCRCQVCSADHSREMRDAAEKRAQAPLEKVPHGLSGYKNWSCRCPVCKAAYANAFSETTKPEL